MSKSYRDDLWYRNKHHNEVCTRWWYRWHNTGIAGRANWCVCQTWHDWNAWDFPPPSWWNKGIRRSERAFARNRMQRARTGGRDWTAVDEKRGDEYYW